ncbi:hypothetical protein [Nonomuraea sp. NPDC050643]|uniref:hypothetical protein n=1 Tax=Nonomuraea sp. NPDC050643 TaxID=3155660 RepID=UPI003403EB44
MSIKRLAAVAALALPATFALAVPAHADGSHSCFFGSLSGETLNANGCSGAGYVNVTVTVFSGDPGSYLCRSAFSWNGTMSASGCRLQ